MGKLLEINDLSVSFDIKGGLFLRTIGTITAVNKVSFTIDKGEILGVVGESGCGKSTLARLILRLVEPDSGSVLFNGTDVLKMSKKALRRQRRHMQMVFQDPYSAMDPRYTIFRSLIEPFQIQGVKLNHEERRKKIDDLLELVGLSSEHGSAYPHELSGGQKQRADIARALSLSPRFIILDEPTAALDVSVQAQIIKLLEGLRERLNLTFLFISHDLSLVSYFCDRVIIMYLGSIVENVSAHLIGKTACHPYTRALIASIFKTVPEENTATAALEGEVPSPFNLPSGCVFASRCKYVQSLCREQTPILKESPAGGQVACHFPLYN
ncbi:MAG: ABC transporter ATP-binding protein [Desulfopila sp.]|jgi:oligopeptide/dipeptide ABC transporter ATP-binding protein|nr:ABC transporter ATP-binding protein [Desulfopila sp.]